MRLARDHISPALRPRTILLAPNFTPYTEGVGEDARRSVELWEKAVEHFLLPLTRETIEQKFRALTAAWQSETILRSSVTAIATHPAYQRIIGMGACVVPLILRELEMRPNHWFWALKAITGCDPVAPSERGRLKNMAEAWLRWAKQEGYEW